MSWRSEYIPSLLPLYHQLHLANNKEVIVLLLLLYTVVFMHACIKQTYLCFQYVQILTASPLVVCVAIKETAKQLTNEDSHG